MVEMKLIFNLKNYFTELNELVSTTKTSQLLKPNPAGLFSNLFITIKNSINSTYLNLFFMGGG